MTDDYSPWKSDEPVPEPEFGNWVKRESLSGLQFTLGEGPENVFNPYCAGDWWFLSYRPSQEVDLNTLPKAIQLMVAITGDKDKFNRETTALIWFKHGSQKERYYELHGDWRAQFEAEIANGPAAVVEFVRLNAAHQTEGSKRALQWADALDANAAMQEAKGEALN